MDDRLGDHMAGRGWDFGGLGVSRVYGLQRGTPTRVSRSATRLDLSRRSRGASLNWVCYRELYYFSQLIKLLDVQLPLAIYSLAIIIYTVH